MKVVIKMLMTRDKFREAVFDRDGRCCVICGDGPHNGVAIDAHHIMERRLFPDGGYYLDNGVTLCDDGNRHHMDAEMTLLSPKELRSIAGIKTLILPPGLDDFLEFDKWGNAYLSNGHRSPGPLFNDESVQKVLRQGGVLDQFEQRFKHPRTPHLPWSPGRNDTEDKTIESLEGFEGEEVVATLKMDGENCSMTRDHVYARSLDSGYHPTRTWVGGLHGRIAHEIPRGWRLVGENLHGVHSIKYDRLPSYFALFAIFDEDNLCLSWDETLAWADLLDLTPVPQVYRGGFDPDYLASWNDRRFLGLHDWSNQRFEFEGYVLRTADPISYYDWHRKVAKYVRPNHVTTDRHWRHKPVEVNGLAKVS